MPQEASPTISNETSVLVSRLERLERSNRRMKCAGVALLAALGLAIGLGFQDAPRTLRADEVHADVMRADAFIVRTMRGEVRIDQNGFTMVHPGTADRRHNVVQHEARIEIGMDHEWQQDNGLRPTPRVIVGRVGKDTAENLVTRAAVLSPEGVHSGQWHTNNPRHDGRTDRDLIDELRRRN